MKKFLCLYLFSLLFFFSSCTDLTEHVYDQLDGDKFLKGLTERDMESLMTPVYGDMRVLYAGSNAHKTGCWFYTGEETAGIQITPQRGSAWYDGGVFERLHGHTWTVDDKLILGPWQQFYKGVNDCNRLVYLFSDTTLKVDSVKRIYLLSQLKVARAFWYYCLVDFFGNVPLVTTYDVPKGFLPKTAPRDSVFNFCVTEISAAIPNLHEDGYAIWNKYAAMHLLARLYLNSEVWTGTPQYNKVDSLCQIIMNSKKYGLESDYKKVFVTENQYSPEIIFAIPNDEIYNVSEPFLPHLWSFHWKTYSHLMTVTKYWGGMCGEPAFIDSYHPEDTRKAKSWLWGQQYDNLGVFGVKGAPMLCEGWRPDDAGKLLDYENTFTPNSQGVGEQEGYRMFKYEIKPGALPCLSNDFVLFRYADVYFMRAEALWRKNNKVATSLVTSLLNAVRKRSFTDYSGAKVLLGSQLDDDRFLKEYGWEFCQEGCRRQQLIRFGKFTTYKWMFHTSSQPYRVLFPIPYAESVANPNLVQNSGY
jgi:hypothetical protein